MLSRLVTAAVLAACVGFATSGCLVSHEVTGNEERSILKPVETGDEEPARTRLQEMGQPWTCFASITYDRNWHDDVLCTNGVESLRPILRPGDPFVTPDEMMESARNYEDELNADIGTQKSKRAPKDSYSHSNLEKWLTKHRAKSRG